MTQLVRTMKFSFQSPCGISVYGSENEWYPALSEIARGNDKINEDVEGYREEYC